MDHVIKMSAETFGYSAKTSLNKEERAVLFTKWIMGQTNQKGMTIAELLNYVLYGGKPSLCGKGSIWQAKTRNTNSSITVLTLLLKWLVGQDQKIRLPEMAEPIKPCVH
jgi:hypothetical protein